MPYIIGHTELFLGGVALLIVGLLVFRIYLARKIKKHQEKQTPHSD